MKYSEVLVLISLPKINFLATALIYLSHNPILFPLKNKIFPPLKIKKNVLDNPGQIEKYRIIDQFKLKISNLPRRLA